MAVSIILKEKVTDFGVTYIVQMMYTFDVQFRIRGMVGDCNWSEAE